jgi:hypothetical protein
MFREQGGRRKSKDEGGRMKDESVALKDEGFK